MMLEVEKLKERLEGEGWQAPTDSTDDTSAMHRSAMAG